MRAYLSATLMGIGGIFVSFGAVVFLLEIFASRSDPEHRLPVMTALGMETVIGGAILIVLGFLLARFGRRRERALGEPRRAWAFELAEKRAFAERTDLVLVEAAVETLDDARAAERAGVDRIELCANLAEGGTTPDPELIVAVRRAVRIPVFVMVRERAGDFAYSPEELSAMLRGIARVIDAGADGVVTGALVQGEVDINAMEQLITAVGNVPVTFHRAFDQVRDFSKALEQLVALGVSRILTSGGAASADDGADIVAELAGQSGERVIVIAGGGVRAHNVGHILARSHVREVHSRLVDEPTMRRLVEVVREHH
jgi:copper homeostasis protein